MMNAAQIHLGLNHLPIALTLVGVSLLAVALKRKSTELKATASILLILSALVALPVFFSGEPAEEIVEHRAGVTEMAIHEHEEAGELAFIFVEVVGGLTLLLFFMGRFKRNLPELMWWGVVILGAINLVAFIRTAHLGGLIRHDELGSTQPAGHVESKSDHDKDD